MANLEDQTLLCYNCATGNKPIENKPKEIHFKGDNLSITFMSADEDQKAYDGYFAQMPWESNGFDREVYEEMEMQFKPQGIPCLVLLGPDGHMFYNGCRGDVDALTPEQCLAK